jgi:hypothetical protein
MSSTARQSRHCVISVRPPPGSLVTNAFAIAHLLNLHNSVFSSLVPSQRAYSKQQTTIIWLLMTIVCGERKQQMSQAATAQLVNALLRLMNARLRLSPHERRSYQTVHSVEEITRR